MTLRDITIPTFYSDSRGSAVSQYYANVVVPTVETGMLRLNGQSVSGFTAVAGTGYSYACIPLTYNAVNHLYTFGSGFNGYAYGLGENWEGYAFSLGGRDTIASYSGFITLEIDTSLCYEQLPCVIGNHEFTRAGNHRFGDGRCTGDTLLHLHLRYGSAGTLDTALCDTTFAYGDTQLAVPGRYHFTATAANGCDSTTDLTLTLSPSYHIYFDTAACGGTIEWQGTTITAPGTTLQYLTQQGCDSLVSIHLAALPVTDTTYRVTLEGDESYTWVDGVTYSSDTIVLLSDTNSYGCDSILRLIITCIPDADTSRDRLWIPNVFTPGRETNSTFHITTMAIDELTVAIYDRQGMLVATYDGLTADWDGTHHGTPCPQAAYVYYIRYHVTGSRETPPPLLGTILLLR